LVLFAQADELPKSETAPLQGRLPELPLRPLALIGLRDELRPDAAEVLRALAKQKMSLKIISGDHADTVQATLRQLQLPLHGSTVVSGAELAASAEPAPLIATASIFARVAPRQKVEIVEALQRLGHRVAMVGDGINDILAIKRADL